MVELDDAARLPEWLEGPRVVLRRWTVTDVGALAELVAANLEHLRPWMPWVAEEPLTPVARLALIESWERDWMAGGDVTLAITLAGRPVGSTGLHRRGPPHHVAIGYFVDKDHLRMGIATEATAILTAAALGLDPLAAVAGVNVVEIHHDRANVRSRRVPERLGYRFAGESPNAKLAPGEEGVDCAWEMTLERWRARPQTQ